MQILTKAFKAAVEGKAPDEMSVSLEVGAQIVTLKFAQLTPEAQALVIAKSEWEAQLKFLETERAKLSFAVASANNALIQMLTQDQTKTTSPPAPDR